MAIAARTAAIWERLGQLALRELSVRSDVKQVMVVRALRNMTVLVVIVVVATMSPPASALDQDSAVAGDDRFQPPVENALETEQAVSSDVVGTGPKNDLSLPAVPILQSSSETANVTDIPPPIVFHDGFESLSLWGGRSPSSRNRVNLIPGFEGAGLHVTIPRGSHFGADFRLDLDKTLGEDPEHLFFRYFLRFDRDWSSASAGKLPGFAGVYGRTGLGGYPSQPYAPGWSSRMQFFPTRKGDPRTSLGYYVYHLGQRERYGDSMRWNEAGKLVPGDWYCLEGKIQLNSLGSADGKLRAWVDGIPAFDEAGLEFRRPNEPNIRIESFWFNVYYGGKTVPKNELGLTIDNVAVGSERIGCGVGGGASGSVEGDLDRDGLDDQLTWNVCPDGPCFGFSMSTAPKRETTAQVTEGAWFSLQTHRFGMTSGDLDGDGLDELIYRGRCERSAKCWKVHQFTGSALSSGEDWKGRAWFAPTAATLVAGDWDGDGREDIAYQGRCKGVDGDCWRVHRSRGNRIAGPENWGSPPAESLRPIAADVTGDGSDDLVYTAACGEEQCWYGQVSLGSGFGEAMLLGPVKQHELEGYDFVDFDGDGRADLVSVRRFAEVSRIVVRPVRDEGLAAPVRVAVLDDTEADVQFRRVGVHRRTEAIVSSDCGKQAPCVQKLATKWSMELLPVSPLRHLRVRIGEVRAR